MRNAGRLTMFASIVIAAAVFTAEPTAKELRAMETELFKLWREIAVADAEAAVAADSKDKQAKLRLAAAKKLPMRPGQLLAAVGSAGYSPDPLYLIQPVDDTQFVTRLGDKDVVVKGLNSPPSEGAIAYA